MAIQTYIPVHVYIHEDSVTTAWGPPPAQPTTRQHVGHPADTATMTARPPGRHPWSRAHRCAWAHPPPADAASNQQVARPPIATNKHNSHYKLLAPASAGGLLPARVVAHPASLQPAHVPAAPHSGAGAPAPWTGRVVGYPSLELG